MRKGKFRTCICNCESYLPWGEAYRENESVKLKKKGEDRVCHSRQQVHMQQQRKGGQGKEG